MASDSDKKYAAPIGIDLGTTYSCVSVWQNDRVEVIANDLGERTTPSYVAFTENNERLIGAAAKNQAARNPTNTIFDAKRLIGRRFSDEIVQKDVKMWPFKVVRGDNDKPLIEVECEGKRKQFSAEEISAFVLQKMKQTAEDFLGKPVKDAVVTCPAYFNSAQRQATIAAGKIAGLNVMRVINEPTAAAIAYGLDKTKDKEKNVIVFDWGGGTLDVSVVNIDEGVFEVKSTAGDTHLGGEDVDNILVNHFVKEFRRKSKLDISKSQRALRRLRSACEKAKRLLSSSIEAPIEVDSLYESVDFYSKISRARFNELCGDLFLRVLAPITLALRDAGLEKSQIDEVVLVGGSSKIVQVQRMISDLFGGKQLNKSINPDEAVAYGAAIQASILGGTASGSAKECLLIDVVPLSLGVEAAGGRMAVIIDRNSPVPSQKSKVFSTNRDNQAQVTVKVYQGERPHTRDNVLLGDFAVTNIPPMKRGVPKIEVRFDVDTDGILHVTAEEKTSGQKGEIKITNDSTLSSDQVEKMLAEAEQFAEKDAQAKELRKWFNIIENYAYNMASKANDDTKDPLGYVFCEEITSEEADKLRSVSEQTIDWVYADGENASLEQLQAKQKEIEAIYNDIVEAVHARGSAKYEEQRATSQPNEQQQSNEQPMNDD